jgi:Cu(I)/Ag(I) efflux system membrane fusion protein
MKYATVAWIVAAAVLGAGGGYMWGAHAPANHSAANAVGKDERKILYYRNPMGLPDTSPVPKKDAMGMDYVPVYAGEETGGASVTVSPERMQLLGVTTEAAQMRKLSRTVRASAVVQPSERNLYDVAPRFSGWVQKLHVNATGERVSRGEPLLTVYSPDLESAVREYQLAEQSGLPDVARSTRKRLQNWEISDRDLAALKHGAANLVLRSPINGVVLAKPATDGARFAAGTVLFRLADLSTVWVQAQVSEQDQANLHLKQPASVTLDAYPGETLQGRVSFIAPVLDPQTRTVEVRVALPNKNGRLRPGMFATVDLSARVAARPVLSIPRSAVIDTGTRQIAMVQVAPGRFAPRMLKLGQQAGDYVEVLSGLAAGELVVSHANFLLDAESNLKSALGAVGSGAGQAAPQAASAPSAAAPRKMELSKTMDMPQSGDMSKPAGRTKSMDMSKPMDMSKSKRATTPMNMSGHDMPVNGTKTERHHAD